MTGKISKVLNLIIAGTLLLTTGCSKNDSAVKTKSDFLVSSVWKVSAIGVNLTGGSTIDYALPLPCFTDNTITFKSDKTGSIDEGASKCDPTATQLTAFTWTLSNNDTQLNLSTSIVVGINSAKINELTDSKFILSLPVSSLPADILATFSVPLPASSSLVVILIH